jgi:hypothetical protein
MLVETPCAGSSGGRKQKSAPEPGQPNSDFRLSVGTSSSGSRAIQSMLPR